MPVTAVLELEPEKTPGSGISLDEIKIVSTYSKVDELNLSSIKDTQNLIDSSKIMYINPNEKETEDWFVSGDDKTVKEAKQFLPWVKTVETKKATAYTRVISKHPKAVIKEIYETVKNAVNEINNMKTFTVPSPVTAEIRYRRCDLASNKRLIDLNGDNFEFVDGYTRKGQLKNIEEIVFRLRV